MVIKMTLEPVDNISHELLMKAVIKHSPNDWTTLYIERWLKAPIKDSDFVYYAFDRWITDTMRSVRFVRYADDAVVHCKSQAELVLLRS